MGYEKKEELHRLGEELLFARRNTAGSYIGIFTRGRIESNLNSSIQYHFWGESIVGQQKYSIIEDFRLAPYKVDRENPFSHRGGKGVRFVVQRQLRIPGEPYLYCLDTDSFTVDSDSETEPGIIVLRKCFIIARADDVHIREREERKGESVRFPGG